MHLMGLLKKNIIYSGILTTANYIFPLLTYPYVSRVLGVSNIGACNFVDSVINYFLILSALGIGVVGIREIAKNKVDKVQLEQTFSKLFTINTITTSIALAVLLVAIHFVPDFQEYYELMWVGVLKLVFNYLLIEWFYKGMEDFKYITNRTVAVRFIYVVSVFLFVKNADDVILYYFLSTATIIVNAIINVLYARKFLRIRLSFSGLKEHATSMSILGIYSILTSMYTTFNVAYLGFVSSDVEVGYYTTATKIHTIILMAFTAVTGVLMPRMASILFQKHYDEYERLIKKSVKILMAFAIPSIIMIEILAPFIIRFLAGSGYEGAILPLRIIAPLIFVIGFEQILITQSLMPMGKDKAILMNSILGAFVGFTANLVIVPHLASVGSAIVWVISESMVMILAFYNFSKEWRKIKRRFVTSVSAQNRISS